MIIYLNQKLQRVLTFFKVSHWWQIHVRRLALTIKNCSAKCIIVLLSKQDDEEVNAFFNKLADSECDMTVEKYVNLDVEPCSSLPGINSDVVDWG